LFSSTQGLVSIGIWEIPLLASLYAVKLAAVARDDTRLEIHTRRNWYHLDPEGAGKNGLALGRWQHLLGKANQPENCDEIGAKKIYLSQRLPEYEIAQLRNDVSLQLQYGIRRDLGVTPSEYDSQIIKIQEIMRLGKLTATYWLGIIQFESSNFESAVDWLKICIFDDHESSALSSAARYNLARCYENLGDVSSAVELLRTKGDSQEHGNRIRSRLLLKQER
jgi:tetratricopeptide (TPR) repeat protein